MKVARLGNDPDIAWMATSVRQLVDQIARELEASAIGFKELGVAQLRAQLAAADRATSGSRTPRWKPTKIASGTSLLYAIA